MGLGYDSPWSSSGGAPLNMPANHTIQTLVASPLSTPLVGVGQGSSGLEFSWFVQDEELPLNSYSPMTTRWPQLNHREAGQDQSMSARDPRTNYAHSAQSFPIPSHSPRSSPLSHNFFSMMPSDMHHQPLPETARSWPISHDMSYQSFPSMAMSASPLETPMWPLAETTSLSQLTHNYMEAPSNRRLDFQAPGASFQMPHIETAAAPVHISTRNNPRRLPGPEWNYLSPQRALRESLAGRSDISLPEGTPPTSHPTFRPDDHDYAFELLAADSESSDAPDYALPPLHPAGASDWGSYVEIESNQPSLSFGPSARSNDPPSSQGVPLGPTPPPAPVWGCSPVWGTVLTDDFLEQEPSEWVRCGEEA